MPDTECYPGLRTASTRLENHRRAAQGDATAKREIEARDLLRAADEATSRLRERAAEGDQQAIATLRAIASGGAPATATSARPAGLAQADVDRAVSAGVRRERERVAAVYASEHSKGRERGCAALLSSDKGWSAAQIIAELPNLPTDRENAARNPAAKARSAAVWERAQALNSGQPVAADPKGHHAASDAVWDRTRETNAGWR